MLLFNEQNTTNTNTSNTNSVTALQPCPTLPTVQTVTVAPRLSSTALLETQSVPNVVLYLKLTPLMRTLSGEYLPTSHTTMTRSVSVDPPTHFSLMVVSPPSLPNPTVVLTVPTLYPPLLVGGRLVGPTLIVILFMLLRLLLPWLIGWALLQPSRLANFVSFLVFWVSDRANEIYKKVEDQKPLRSRNQDAILAACLYIACRQEDKPRTVKEICSVANGATKKEIGRAKEFIVKQLEGEMGQSVEMGAIHAGDFLRRFCSHLGMDKQAVKAAQEAVKKSEELDIRRSPISIAAAIIYIVTQLSEDKKPLKDISLATGVAEGTIRNSYKDLHPYVSRIIPSWYAMEEDLRNLSNP